MEHTRRRAGQADLTRLAAAKFVESHGRAALAILDERAARAAELGHKLAAQTWRDMADAAARLLGIERRPALFPMSPPARPAAGRLQ